MWNDHWGTLFWPTCSLLCFLVAPALFKCPWARHWLKYLQWCKGEAEQHLTPLLFNVRQTAGAQLLFLCPGGWCQRGSEQGARCCKGLSSERTITHTTGLGTYARLQTGARAVSSFQSLLFGRSHFLRLQELRINKQGRLIYSLLAWMCLWQTYIFSMYHLK